jgi:hypothetical protein
VIPVTTTDLTTLFVSLWLIAQDRPATVAEGAWMAWDERGATVWETGRVLNLVGPAERDWARLPPIRCGEGLISDHKRDLNVLRRRAHPLVGPCRE